MAIDLTDLDQRVRGILTRAIAELGHAPSPLALASAVGCDLATLDAHLRRLADALFASHGLSGDFWKLD